MFFKCNLHLYSTALATWKENAADRVEDRRVAKKAMRFFLNRALVSAFTVGLCTLNSFDP